MDWRRPGMRKQVHQIEIYNWVQQLIIMNWCHLSPTPYIQFCRREKYNFRFVSGFFWVDTWARNLMPTWVRFSRLRVKRPSRVGQKFSLRDLGWSPSPPCSRYLKRLMSLHHINAHTWDGLLKYFKFKDYTCQDLLSYYV
jgi:hypothetical protein